MLVEKGLAALRNGSDIRGVALEGVEGERVNLTPEAARQLAKGFATWLSHKLDKDVSTLTVAVGRDPRLSGAAIIETVADELAALGIRVLDCGLATTPAMFMSCIFEEFKADGSIMVTASHLPWNRNGLKFFTAEGGVEASDIVAITEYAEADELGPAEAPAAIEQADLISRYAAHLRSLITEKLGEPTPLAGLKIVVDAGNGSAGFFARDVLAPLGADVSASQFLRRPWHPSRARSRQTAPTWASSSKPTSTAPRPLTSMAARSTATPSWPLPRRSWPRTIRARRWSPTP